MTSSRCWNRWVVMWLVSWFSGCGAVSGLEVGVEPEPFSCPNTTIRASLNAATKVEVPPDAIELGLSGHWSIADVPFGSRSARLFADGEGTTFIPDAVGAYGVRWTADDSSRYPRECVVSVVAVDSPVATCIPPEVFSFPGESVTLMGTVSSAEPTTDTMRLVNDGSTPIGRWTPSNGSSGTFVVEGLGRSEVEFRATRSDGVSDSCRFTIASSQPPFALKCPDALVVEPLERVAVEASVLGTPPSSITQGLVSQPEGSATVLENASLDSSLAALTPDIVGVYDVEFEATNSSGEHVSCRTRVTAASRDGFRAELFWLDDASDVDIHLLHPEQRLWFNPDRDCYWSRCKAGLPWFTSSALDDPRLDLDDLVGFGPENVAIEAPVAETYRVGVHLYDDGDGRSATFTPRTAVVKVFCGVGQVEPEWQSAPMRFGDASATFWRVADVVVSATGCDVRPINTLADVNDAMSRR